MVGAMNPHAFAATLATTLLALPVLAADRPPENLDETKVHPYVLPDPLLLPPGTELECIGHFDNSKDNPNNPDPTQAVRWGDQSFEEMFIGFFDKVVPLE